MNSTNDAGRNPPTAGMYTAFNNYGPPPRQAQLSTQQVTAIHMQQPDAGFPGGSSPYSNPASYGGNAGMHLPPYSVIPGPRMPQIQVINTAAQLPMNYGQYTQNVNDNHRRMISSPPPPPPQTVEHITSPGQQQPAFRQPWIPAGVPLQQAAPGLQPRIIAPVQSPTSYQAPVVYRMPPHIPPQHVTQIQQIPYGQQPCDPITEQSVDRVPEYEHHGLRQHVPGQPSHFFLQQVPPSGPIMLRTQPPGVVASGSNSDQFSNEQNRVHQQPPGTVHLLPPNMAQPSKPARYPQPAPNQVNVQQPHSGYDTSYSAQLGYATAAVREQTPRQQQTVAALPMSGQQQSHLANFNINPDISMVTIQQPQIASNQSPYYPQFASNRSAVAVNMPNVIAPSPQQPPPATMLFPPSMRGVPPVQSPQNSYIAGPPGGNETSSMHPQQAAQNFTPYEQVQSAENNSSSYGVGGMQPFYGQTRSGSTYSYDAALFQSGTQEQVQPKKKKREFAVKIINPTTGTEVNVDGREAEQSGTTQPSVGSDVVPGGKSTNIVEGLAGNDTTSMYDSAVETMSGASISVSSQSDDVSAAVSDSCDKTFSVHEQYLPPDPPADSSSILADASDYQVNADTSPSVIYLPVEPCSSDTDGASISNDIGLTGSRDVQQVELISEAMDSLSTQDTAKIQSHLQNLDMAEYSETPTVSSVLSDSVDSSLINKVSNIPLQNSEVVAGFSVTDTLSKSGDLHAAVGNCRQSNNGHNVENDLCVSDMSTDSCVFGVSSPVSSHGITQYIPPTPPIDDMQMLIGGLNSCTIVGQIDEKNEAAENHNHDNSESEIQIHDDITTNNEDVGVTHGVLSETEVDMPDTPKARFVIGEFDEKKPNAISDAAENDQPTSSATETTVLLPSSNCTPKFRYDREFLLSLRDKQESTSKPADLPDLPDIILELPASKSQFGAFVPDFMQFSQQKMNDFTPDFARTASYGWLPGGVGMAGLVRHDLSQKRGSFHALDQHMAMQQQQQPRIVISLQQDVRLNRAENAYKPQFMAKSQEELDAETAKTETVGRKFRSILNKLTPEKYDTLLKQVVDLQSSIDTEDRLHRCIEIIFEKAIDEPKFAVTYANLSRTMINIQVPLKENPEITTNFRKVLLNCCQQEFEKCRIVEDSISKQQCEIEGAATDEERAVLIAEKDAAESKARRRSVGNMTFIGELFKQKMLTENIMFECIHTLLRKPQDDNIECLCKLFTTIGKDIDTEKNKQIVKVFFDHMAKLMTCNELSSRIRFAVRDVIDLRKNQWVPRRASNDPRKIGDIHKDFVEEKQQQAILLSRLPPAAAALDQKQLGGGPGMGRGRAAGGKLDSSEEGWMAVGSSKGPAIDPGRLKVTKQQDADSIQLGPSSSHKTGWQRGSTGGGAGQQVSKDEQSDMFPSNRASETPTSRDRPSGQHARSAAAVPLRPSASPHRPHSTTVPPRFQKGNRSMEGVRKDVWRSDSPGAAADSGHRSFSPIAILESAHRSGSRSFSPSMGTPEPAAKASPRPYSPMLEAVQRASPQSSSPARSQDGILRTGSPRSFSPIGYRENLRLDSPRSNSPSLHRDSPRSDSPSEAEEMDRQKADASSISDDMLRLKAKDILEEFLEINNYTEAVTCIQSLSATVIPLFVSVSIEHMLSTTSVARNRVGTLFATFVADKVFTSDDFTSGLRFILENAADLLVDIPKLWSYLAELTCPALDVINISVLVSLVQQLRQAAPENERLLGNFMAEILVLASEQMGKVKLRRLWCESQCSFSDIMSSTEVPRIIKDYKLEFLLEGSEQSPAE